MPPTKGHTRLKKTSKSAAISSMTDSANNTQAAVAENPAPAPELVLPKSAQGDSASFIMHEPAFINIPQTSAQTQEVFFSQKNSTTMPTQQYSKTSAASSQQPSAILQNPPPTVKSTNFASKFGDRAFRLKLVMLFALVILVAMAGLVWYAKPVLLGFKTAPAKKTGNANQDYKYVIDKIQNVLSLPQEEQPTLAKVSDIEKLKSYPFFKNAQNGDWVVVYNKAAKAVLYRESSDKIIDIVNLVPDNAASGTSSNIPSVSGTGNTATNQTNPAVPAPQPTILVLNGTKISGLAGKTQSKIKTAGITTNTISTGNANSSEYSQSLVVNVSGKFSEQTMTIAKLINAQVSNMPPGEKQPAVDILVITAQ